MRGTLFVKVWKWFQRGHEPVPQPFKTDSPLFFLVASKRCSILFALPDHYASGDMMVWQIQWLIIFPLP